MKKSKIGIAFILAVAGAVLCGGTIIFSGDTVMSAQDGTSLYAQHCGACHPQGETPMNPTLPVTGSAKMKSYADFSAFNRNPLKADGSKGIMPSFPPDKISDQEMKLIYEYSLTLKGTGK
jgi:mono/diheme cytochrome c family protein